MRTRNHQLGSYTIHSSDGLPVLLVEEEGVLLLNQGSQALRLSTDGRLVIGGEGACLFTVKGQELTFLSDEERPDLPSENT